MKSQSLKRVRHADPAKRSDEGSITHKEFVAVILPRGGVTKGQFTQKEFVTPIPLRGVTKAQLLTKSSSRSFCQEERRRLKKSSARRSHQEE
jgi:hypothetical protein